MRQMTGSAALGSLVEDLMSEDAIAIGKMKGTREYFVRELLRNRPRVRRTYSPEVVVQSSEKVAHAIALYRFEREKRRGHHVS